MARVGQCALAQMTLGRVAATEMIDYAFDNLLSCSKIHLVTTRVS